ncbi:sugar phosphate isomerase/epimerase [Amycolatopsis sp. DSM 110486]|uniref:sugar phosphate isomerase/epimerase family protein n=1 Tax=Amycolatopsis sp. DSM 110486 TaxID=2865832 RepID=UPI001C6A11C1|nr:sugar phosphate isomerase/epimerase family protein [Amycolatopsis sp. DSM 110486]QYN19140.1 sugar phosphate isomerase/epimerase [Amycolatopsis sp. DSM 110486]
MKWSYPYGTPEVEADILGMRGDPEDVLTALAGLGYDGVELFVRDPTRIDLAALDAAVAAAGLAVTAIGTGPAVADDKLTFTDPHAAVRSAAVARTVSVIDLAAHYDSQVNIGKLRGRTRGHPDARRWMRECLLESAEHAARVGVTLTLEPQNGSVIDNLNTTQAGVEFVRELGHPNVALMVDIYHAQIEDRRPSLAYLIAGDQLRHVHFADSNRGAPGRGNIDFGLHVATLTALGYQGAVTFELDQRDDSLATAAEALAHLTTLDR